MVDLWRFRRDLAANEILRLRGLLDAVERGRAVRLVNNTLAGHFIIGRGRLREILSRYLRQPPAHIVFDYGPYGKPQLVGSAAGQISFNLAHSGAWGLLAVTAAFPVGVDIERIAPDFPWQGVASRYFPETEQTILSDLPPSRRRRGFYRCWVRREAVMKMTGTGFAGACKTNNGGEYSVRVLPVARGYLGGVAAVEQTTDIRRFDLS